MNSDLQSTCKNIPDSGIPIVLKELFRAAFEKDPPNELHGIPELDELMSKGDDLLEAEVRMPEGIEIGRSLLVEFAGTPNLVPFVEKACAEAKKKMETRMVIPGLVEFGTFVMLSYLIMSSSVSVQKGADGKTTWKFGKKASSPEFVKAFLTKLTNIASRAALTN